MITRIELSYSTSVEKQLAQKLLTFEDSDRIINMTHQQLACEIGSVREVVSRQLKKFENKGWIKMSRGVLRLVTLKCFLIILSANGYLQLMATRIKIYCLSTKHQQIHCFASYCIDSNFQCI